MSDDRSDWFDDDSVSFDAAMTRFEALGPHPTTGPRVDLPVDLNAEDETGLPWGLRDAASSPDLLREGAWIIVGSHDRRAVAQIADIAGNVVHVRPLPGPVSKHRHLIEHLAG